MRNRISILFVFFIFLMSCSLVPSKLSSQELAKWYLSDECELSQKKELDLFFVKAEYIPLSLQVLKESGHNQNEYQRLLPSYEGSEYYTLTIGLKDSDLDVLKSGLSNKAYPNMIDYLSFKIANDIHLKVGDEVLNPELCHFERSYGMHPAIKLSLAFSRVKSSADRVLVYNDQLFDLGKLKLGVTYKAIKAVPALKWD